MRVTPWTTSVAIAGSILRIITGYRDMAVLSGLIILLAGTACATRPEYYRDDFWGRDKVYHAVASAVIGGGAAAAARNNGMDGIRAPMIGISVATTVGAGKEWYDYRIRETFWSWKDLFWDVAGGTAGAWLVTIGD